LLTTYCGGQDLMTIKIRSTESLIHPIVQRLNSEYIISDIQGFIFTSTDQQLFEATLHCEKSIKIQCLEAVEYDEQDEFKPLLIFSYDEWVKKINTANFFNSSLFLLSCNKKDNYLFRLYNVTHEKDKIIFSEINKFLTEKDFITWWNSIKLLTQLKATYEARERQHLTCFDKIIEKNGSAWGGNIDGIILSDSMEVVKGIIEIRQTHSFPLNIYDPAKFFLGTYKKSGDFKTWLPLVYLKKAYDIPLILITISSEDKTRLGYTEVDNIDKTALHYVNDIHPYDNVTNDFNKYKDWLNTLIK
jgi:hypothetical protein